MDKFSDPLLSGTTLLQGQYRIKTFLNDGGFGITYLATDSLDRPIVIKECFPRAICRRSGQEVGTRALSHREEFRSIVKAFEEEARNLSKFEHPNIIKVHQVFDENQTAYMAMDYVDGQELITAIEQKKLTPDTIISIALKLLDALGEIHASGMLHRDISPDNILLDQGNNPILIDFGAAKQEATQHGPKMTSIRVTKEGYSPQEFYVSGAQQFPSSDLYALAATLYHAITGTVPPESQARLLALAQERPDPYQALSGHHNAYPSGLLKAIDGAMSIAPKDRLNSAQDWLILIDKPQNLHDKSKLPQYAAYLSGAVIIMIGLGIWQISTNQETVLATTPPIQSIKFTYLAPKITQTYPWVIELPFTVKTRDTSGLEITAVSAWADPDLSGQWLGVGVGILSVNGKTTDKYPDLSTAILLSQDQPFPNPLVVNIRYQTTPDTPPKQGKLQLYPTRSQTYSNGMQLAEQFRTPRWQLVVASAPKTIKTDIKIGDVFLAERVLGLSAVTLAQLDKVLQKLEQRNLPKGVFSVRRDNSVELANLPLKQVSP
jgi:serine/threonine protein kinase